VLQLLYNSLSFISSSLSTVFLHVFQVLVSMDKGEIPEKYIFLETGIY